MKIAMASFIMHGSANNHPRSMHVNVYKKIERQAMPLYLNALYIVRERMTIH